MILMTVELIGGVGGSEYKEWRVMGKSSAESLERKAVVQPGGGRQDGARWDPGELAIIIIGGDEVEAF